MRVNIIRCILLISSVTIVYLSNFVKADAISDQIKRLESELKQQKLNKAIQELKQILSESSKEEGENFRNRKSFKNSRKHYKISDKGTNHFYFNTFILLLSSDFISISRFRP